MWVTCGNKAISAVQTSTRVFPLTSTFDTPLAFPTSAKASVKIPGVAAAEWMKTLRVQYSVMNKYSISAHHFASRAEAAPNTPGRLDCKDVRGIASDDVFQYILRGGTIDGLVMWPDLRSLGVCVCEYPQRSAIATHTAIGSLMMDKSTALW